jgi:hypothetical protein
MKKIWYNFLTKLGFRKRDRYFNFAANLLFEKKKRKRYWPVYRCNEIISAITSAIGYLGSWIYGAYAGIMAAEIGVGGITVGNLVTIGFLATSTIWSLGAKPSHQSFTQGKELHVSGGSIVVDYFEKGGK